MTCDRCEGFGKIWRYLDVSDRDGTWSEQALVECPECHGQADETQPTENDHESV